MSSIKDVARITGCSPSTVSRVVNKKGNISEETERRVLEAIEQVGYIPNSVARSLKNCRTNTIGVIVPDISESFFAQLIKGINLVSVENGCSIMLCESEENPERESSLISLLNENRVDGLIVATVQSDDQIVNSVQQVTCPIVFVDNVPSSIQGYDSVSTDNIKASYLAIEHLVAQGHSRIAAIMGKRTEHVGFERYSGYLKALSHHNIAVDNSLIRFGDFKEQSGYTAMKELLESGSDFTAVYIASSKMTYGAMMAIREAGLRIPEDIALVGFDIQGEYPMLPPGIATVCQQDREAGRRAAKIMFRRMEEASDLSVACEHVVLDPFLKLSESGG